MSINRRNFPGLDFKVAHAAQELKDIPDFVLGYLDNVLGSVDEKLHEDRRSPYAQGVNAAYHDSN